MKTELKIRVITFLLSLLLVSSVTAQLNLSEIDTVAVPGKVITYNPEKLSLYSNQLDEGTSIPLFVFFDDNDKTSLSAGKSEISIFKSATDHTNSSHYRAKQYYNGIEVAEVQILMHKKDGKVYLAHGNLVPGIASDTIVAISEKQAYAYALKHLASDAILWNIPQDDKAHRLLHSGHNSKLVFTPGRNNPDPESFKLAYRFDIVTRKPLGRYLIDIDAKTGKLVNKISRLYEGDVLSSGQSLYHDVVPITVSDEDYPEWRDSTKWGTYGWEAFGKTGRSWWLADTALGIYGGYDNHWYDVLETPPVVLSGANQKLSFFHRYSVELPEVYEEYDGWDGMNVRISADRGKTWQILNNPNHPYTCSSLYSFGSEHAEGSGIPGWAGKMEQWTRVVFDLSDFRNDTVTIRFAFASDPAFSTVDGNDSLFGWQIDNIRISNNFGPIFFDDGTNSQMIPKNVVSEVKIIEGNYRLREVGRGGGISTYNALNVESYNESTDFVSSQSFFNDINNQAGVSAHWAQEVTYDYFLNHHGRKSYDDENGRLIAYVNWSSESGKNNAFWIGYASLFGAGNGGTVNPLSDLDIVGHEITHGVTESSAGLIYENEPGALNESFSDIFGIAIEINKLGLNENSWQIGENVTESSPNIRSMKDPNSRHSPDTYKGKYWRNSTDDPVSNNDYGGVHYNSGVQNYWFYLLSAGGQGVNDNGDSYTVSGIGVEDAARIAYRNLTLYLQPTSVYYDAANYSVQSAIDLFGENSVQHLAVIDAWYATGIYFTPKINVPSELIFRTNPGGSAFKNIYVHNLGMQDLILENIQLAGNRFQLFSDSLLPLTLSPGEQYVFKVTYEAYSEIEESGLITISSNDPYHPVKEISLTGTTEMVTSTESAYVNQPEYNLLQNYPNPFSEGTTIHYKLMADSYVLIRIYDISGEEVRTLVRQSQPEGIHRIWWDGHSNSGNRANAGIYLCVIQTKDYTYSKRLILLSEPTHF